MMIGQEQLIMQWQAMVDAMIDAVIDAMIHSGILAFWHDDDAMMLCVYYEK